MGKINLVFKYFKKKSGRLKMNKTSFYHLILYLPKWLKYRKIGRSSIIDEKPWITFEACDFLIKNILKPNSKVFEYGSGGSSFFFSKAASELVSVEHDIIWYKKVINALEDKKININYILAEPEKLEKPILNPDYSDPNQYLSAGSLFLNQYSFEKYASIIEQYAESYFDIVFIDGRARPSCISHSISKIKKGGVLILDNSDREYYVSHISKELQAFEIIFSKIGPGPYGDDFWGTSIYKKIC